VEAGQLPKRRQSSRAASRRAGGKPGVRIACARPQVPPQHDVRPHTPLLRQAPAPCDEARPAHRAAPTARRAERPLRYAGPPSRCAARPPSASRHRAPAWAATRSRAMEWVCSGCKPPNKRVCAILIARQVRGARQWLADPGEGARDVGGHLIPRHRRPAPHQRARDRLARAHTRVCAHLSPHERRPAAPRAPPPASAHRDACACHGTGREGGREGKGEGGSQ